MKEATGDVLIWYVGFDVVDMLAEESDKSKDVLAAEWLTKNSDNAISRMVRLAEAYLQEYGV